MITCDSADEKNPVVYIKKGDSINVTVQDSCITVTAKGELDVARVIGDRIHMSTREVLKDFLPYLRIIQENNPDMANAILRSVGVSDEEMCSLPFG